MKSMGNGSKRRLSRQWLLTNVGKGSPCRNSPGGAAAASCWGTEREVCHIPAHEGSDLRGPEVWADGNGDNTLRCALWEGGCCQLACHKGNLTGEEEPAENNFTLSPYYVPGTSGLADRERPSLRGAGWSRDPGGTATLSAPYR